MHRFSTGQRVWVANPNHHLHGRKGTVRSLNVGDGGAVVEIDGGLPEAHAIVIQGVTFPNRTVLLPQDCEAVRI